MNEEVYEQPQQPVQITSQARQNFIDANSLAIRLDMQRIYQRIELFLTNQRKDIRKRPDGEIINPQLNVNKEVYNLATKATKILSDNEETLSYIEKKVGKPQYASVYLTPSVCYRGIGFGIFEIAEFDGIVNTQKSMC